jgi:hypothetical protein
MAEKPTKPPSKGGAARVPSAAKFRTLAAEREAAKAAEANREFEVEEERKKALIAELSARHVKPEGVENALRVIRDVAKSGQTEFQLLRFPNELCSDRGRAINNSEPQWPQTLTGFPREVFIAWEKHFKDQGYRLTAKIVDFPGGKPGDVGLYISWD